MEMGRENNEHATCHLARVTLHATQAVCSHNQAGQEKRSMCLQDCNKVRTIEIRRSLGSARELRCQRAHGALRTGQEKEFPSVLSARSGRGHGRHGSSPACIWLDVRATNGQMCRSIKNMPTTKTHMF